MVSERSGGRESAKPDDKRIAKVEKKGDLAAQSARQVFDDILKTLGSATSKDLVARSYRYDVDAQATLNLANTFERAGEKERALRLYEEALAMLETGGINESNAWMTAGDARAMVSGIARLDGNVDVALDQLLKVCEKIISPPGLAAISIREGEKRPNLSGEPKPAMPNDISHIIELLPDKLSAKDWREHKRLKPEYREEVYTTMAFGVPYAGKEAVKAFASSATLAHKLKKNLQSDIFLKKAYEAAQIESASIKDLMHGRVAIREDSRYSSHEADSNLAIAEALVQMDRAVEAVELVIDAHSNQAEYFLTTTIPVLFRTNPKDPKILDLAGRFLRHFSQRGSLDSSTNNALLEIAIILQREFGLKAGPDSQIGQVLQIEEGEKDVSKEEK